MEEKSETFCRELSSLINKLSYDSEAGIPDYILSELLFHNLEEIILMEEARKIHKR